MNHPDIEQLTAYLTNPQSEDFSELCLHLASCVDCRAEVTVLAELKENPFPGLVEAGPDPDDAFDKASQEQLIEKYVDGVLTSEEGQEIETLLQTNPQALKAALHYATHSAGMNREPHDSTGSVIPQQTTLHNRHKAAGKSSLFKTINNWLQLRAPLWLAVPATAVAVALLSINIATFQTASTSGYTVASYQDNPVVQFEQKRQQPGIGFFANAGKTVQSYATIKPRLLGDDGLSISWPAIDKAVAYTIQLQLIKNGQHVTIDELTTKLAQASFKRAPDDTGHRYEWVLSGETTDGKTFSTNGGFVIHFANN